MIDDLFYLNQTLREDHRLLILGEVFDPKNFVSEDRQDGRHGRTD